MITTPWYLDPAPNAPPEISHPRRWDDIDDKLDESERLTVNYFGNAKRYAVRTLQYMGVTEKADDADEVCLLTFSSLRFIVSLPLFRKGVSYRIHTREQKRKIGGG